MPRRFAKVQGPTVSQSACSSSVITASSLSLESLALGHYQLQLVGDALEFTPAVRGVAASRIVLFGAPVSAASLVEWFQKVELPDQYTVSVQQAHPALPRSIELRFDTLLTAEIVEQLYTVAKQHGLELVYQHAEVLLDVPGVLVMDMDSTAIQIECIDEIAKLAGTGEQVAAVTARAMNGELDFAASLRERVATLKDAPEQILADVLSTVPLMPGLTELCQTLLSKQWQVVIASGGFTYFTRALQQRLGLSATYANELEIIHGKLTGRVLGDIVDANTKAQVVQQTAVAHQIPASQTVAIGDGANDLPMLAQAALGVAFHAKPKVQAQAKAAIRQGSLLQLLNLLGAWKA
ncbi:MAG TPA: phosphoserine phosphatase SerB [Rheinheimera sp.]|nr:phosphoserine phosphatase SerB [Rheinheimera sp.]